MSTEMSYIGLASGLADGSGPRLQVATPSGRIREIQLDELQLLRIIRAAATALEVLRKDRES